MIGITPAGAQNQASCCNTETGEWVGILPVAECLALADHVPLTVEYQEEASACSSGSTDTGGGDPISDVEAEIPNGGFEDWPGDKPVGWGSFSTPKGSPVYVETLSRSTDAHSGQYSARVESKQIPGVPVKAIMPGGLMSCPHPCGLQSGNRDLSFPIEGEVQAVCGYYKANFVGADTLMVNLAVRSGETVVGGTDAGPGGQIYFKKSTDEWLPFEIPIVRLPGKQNAKIDNGILQAAILPAGNVLDTSMMGWGATMGEVGSWFQIDTLRFCGPQVGLSVFMPKVAGGMEIPESKEETHGVQGFANLDNDDGDKLFDHQDDDRVEGDNELMRLLLQLPEDANGSAILSQIGGDVVNSAGEQAQAIKIWETADKKPGSEFEKLGKELDLPGDFRLGAGLEKLLWIEPLEPTESRAVTLEFRYENLSGRVEIDRVTVTVLGVEEVSWHGKGNSENDDETLLADPKHPAGGQRVFPGQRPANGAPDGDRRDTVEVEVRLNVAPKWPVDVHLRSFDVDDPSAHDDAVDNESVADDNRSTEMPTGEFVDSGSDIVKLELKAGQTTKRTELKVPMQPGDNVRIVASGDPAALGQLDHSDFLLYGSGGTAALLEIVDREVFAATNDATAASVRQSDKFTSKTLTTWRYVYPEVDRMDRVTGNHVDGCTIDDVVDRTHTLDLGGGNVISKKGSLLALSCSLVEKIATSIGNKGIQHSFFGGEIVIDGVGARGVMGNTARGHGIFDDVWAYPEVPSSASGETFTLKDDDRKHGFDNGAEIQFPPTGALADTFEPAYIVPVLDKLSNATDTVPYVRHMDNDGQDGIRALYVFDNDGIHDLDDFWVVYILGAHQGTTAEDGDAVGTKEILNGIADALENAPGEGQGAVVFEEGVKERLIGEEAANRARAAASPPQPAKDLSGLTWEKSVAHEVGHLFNANHGDGGLIDQEGPDFSPRSLDKMRRVEHP